MLPTLFPDVISVGTTHRLYEGKARSADSSSLCHSFGNRDHARSSLFSAYDDPRSSASTRAKSQSPSLAQGPSYAFGAYPSAPSHLRPASTTGAPYGASSFGGRPSIGTGLGDGSGGGYRSATPNTRGQYSDAVLSELESQNEDQLAGMMGRVRMLKDVSAFRVSPLRPGGQKRKHNHGGLANSKHAANQQR